MSLSDKQPDPVIKSEDQCIWEKVLEDMRERKLVGLERYKTVVSAFNGRNALIDAYQEILDLVVYLRQYIEERASAKLVCKTCRAPWEFLYSAYYPTCECCISCEACGGSGKFENTYDPCEKCFGGGIYYLEPDIL